MYPMDRFCSLLWLSSVQCFPPSFVFLFVEQCATILGGMIVRMFNMGKEKWKKELEASCQFIAQKQFQMDKHERHSPLSFFFFSNNQLFAD